MDETFSIPELLTKILSKINDADIYKTVRLVSKTWLAAVGDRIDEFSNHLWTLIDKFPDEDWDWEGIISNPNTPIEFLIDMDSMTIEPRIISIFTGPEYTTNDYDLIMEDILPIIAGNPYITFEMLQHLTRNYSVLIPWGDISSHPNITLDIIEEYIDAEWDWDEIATHPNLTWKFIQKHIYKFCDIWDTISKHKCITPEIVKSNPSMPWDGNYLLLNPNFTITMVEKLSNTKQVNTKQLNTDLLSGNSNLTWEDIEYHEDNHWSWEFISEHPNITWDIIVNNPTKPWKWGAVLRNPNIQWEHINIIRKKRNNIDIGHNISLNPNITWRIVVDNPDINWNFLRLSRNSFGKKEYNVLKSA